MTKQFRDIWDESLRLKREFFEKHHALLDQAANALMEVLRNGGKVLVFGNGGSAADAQHFAAELVGRYLIERRPLPAVALTTDTSVMTALANDYSYAEIFEKQIRALGLSGDAALGISTSGASENVVRGCRAAKELDMVVIGLGGAEGTPMASTCDIFLPVSGAPTPRIQEVHQLIEHAIAEMIEQKMFGE